MIDLRSDTLTLPSKEMLATILTADLGDDGRLSKDGRGEDNTVNRLEDLAAKMTGKEAAVLFSSGTLGNHGALMAYCEPGDRVLVDVRQHILKAEKAMFSEKCGQLVPVLYSYDQNGLPVISEIEAALKEGGIKLICIENTHNSFGGAVMPISCLKEIRALADEYGVPVHMDGARLFNAAVALGVGAEEICRYADSVMFCISKGLGAPVGSLVCGGREFSKRAKDARKLLGGTMRQAGIIAAPGIYALEHNVDRLKDDHQNARLLADSIRECKRIKPQQRVMSNIVMIDVEGTGLSAGECCERLYEMGLSIYPSQTPYEIRLVFHLGVSHEDTLKAIEILKEFDKSL